MASQSDSDHSASGRPKRNYKISANALDYVTKSLPTLANGATNTQTSTTATVGTVSPTTGNKRPAVDSNAESSDSDAPVVMNRKKRKISQKGKARMTDNEALLDLSYEQVDSVEDRVKWLRAVLHARTGGDYSRIELTDLEVLYVGFTGISLPNRSDSGTWVANVNADSQNKRSKAIGLEYSNSLPIPLSVHMDWEPGPSPLSASTNAANIPSKGPHPVPLQSNSGQSRSRSSPPARERTQEPTADEGTTEEDDPVPGTNHQNHHDTETDGDDDGAGVGGGHSNTGGGQGDRGEANDPDTDGDGDDEDKDKDEGGNGRQRAGGNHEGGLGREGDRNRNRGRSAVASDEETGRNDSCPQPRQRTMRERSQRQNFGKAIPVVDAWTELLLLCALKENPYADCTPYEVEDADGQVFHQGTLFDKIAAEEWTKANALVRPDKSVLPLRREYLKHGLHVFSQLRNQVKADIAKRVESTYGLGPKNSVDKVKKAVKSLLDDSFHASALKPGATDFQHEILAASIKATHFDSGRKPIGYQYPREFQKMPLPVLALHCATTQFMIACYSSGRKQEKTALDAPVQRKYYQYYLATLQRAARPEHVPVRMANIQIGLFNECYTAKKSTSNLPAHAPRDYEADSEVETESVLKV